MACYIDLEADCSDQDDDCLLLETEQDRLFIDDDVEEDYSPRPADLFDIGGVSKKLNVLAGAGVVNGFDHGTFEKTVKTSQIRAPVVKPDPQRARAVKTESQGTNVVVRSREAFAASAGSAVCAVSVVSAASGGLCKSSKRRRPARF
jgi:hypothetical protein